MKIVQDVFEEFIKLNFRCPRGKFVPDSFACGNTPEEAKKNYKAYQKEKKQVQQDRKTTKGAVKSAKDAKKRIKKVSDPVLKEKVIQVKDLIAKVELEKKSGKVSKETYKALKLAVKELKSKKSGSEQKVVPEIKQVAQKVEKPGKVVNSDLAVDTMKSGEIWNAGLMGDIKIDEVDDENDTVTVTANNFTETMTKGALKRALKEYNVTRVEDIVEKIKSGISKKSDTEESYSVNESVTDHPMDKIEYSVVKEPNRGKLKDILDEIISYIS